MKKYCLLLMFFLFLLSGCSGNEMSVNNPYEVAKGNSILSYYDTEDNISIDGFQVLDCEPENIIGIRAQNENRIFVDEGRIRCIYIVDEDIVTYNQISVGDSIDKIKNTYSQISQYEDEYIVIFDNEKEVPIYQKGEDTWINIMYYTDEEKITAIVIYDGHYARYGY